jgi:3-dehydroquinate synthase
MGTGKTSVGRHVAHRLGWRFVDLDEVITCSVGKSVEDIFEFEDEAEFRKLERNNLLSICAEERQVVSTGGGVPTDSKNREIMQRNGIVLCLEALPETIINRIESDYGDKAAKVRPMFNKGDSGEGIRDLKAHRQFAYSQADWTVHTDRLTIEQVADEIIRGLGLLTNQTYRPKFHTSDDPVVTVRTSNGDYPVWVGRGILDEIGERLCRLKMSETSYVITDEGAQKHARRVQAALESSGMPAHIFTLESGEKSKTLEMVHHIYQWLAERKAERTHIVIAVGGGVVGDLAGFVAATFLRGTRFVQVPTTTLAMMDASIGGKTGVDLSQGKNLVGAFYQPMCVLADVDVLQTLPRRELLSGWAEAIKHGLILDEGLFNDLETSRESLLSTSGDMPMEVVRRSVAIKSDVVSRDERETLGLRVLLNYGHSIGHAIESTTGYTQFLHGEAVSIGMMGAGLISHGMGLMSVHDVTRQRNVLEGFGLPIGWPGLDVDSLLEAMTMDKKTSSGALRWVLLEQVGRAVTRSDVPIDLIKGVLDELKN